MSYTNGLDKPTDYFNTVLYTGDGTTSNAITGVGFQPDLVWLKNRSTIAGHHLSDVVRGKSGTNYLSLSTDTDTAEVAQGDNDGVNTLGSDGFTVGYTNSTAWNNSGNNYVAWNWLANNTSGSSNTAGSITSTVAANTTAGFSIVSYTGNGTDNDTATIGHGLGVAPNFIITKCRSEAGGWISSSTSLGWNNVVSLNTTGASSAGTQAFGVTGVTPSSTTFTVSANSGGNHTNINGATYIAYCFAEKKGFSKFSKYTGNGSTDGTFVYTGFKPAWVMIKNVGTSNWTMHDNKRNPYNQVTDRLYANLSNAEDVGGPYGVDFLSNGMKMRTTESTSWNGNGVTFIYMAFAENPFVTSTGIPACAR